jgi:anti-sigma regulatory factor (Ser/Thr protein kinase)
MLLMKRACSHAGSDLHSNAPSYLHQVGFYDSDEAFSNLICPFALGGIEAGEPVVLRTTRTRWTCSVVGSPTHRASPTSPIRDRTPRRPGPSSPGARWSKGTLPRALHGCGSPATFPIRGTVAPYAGWDRYEAALDAAMGDLPVWAPCLYDTRIAPPEVVDAAKRLHHRVLDSDGTHQPNHSFEAVRKLTDFFSPPPDPLEQTAPAVELIDPTPAQVRATVRQLSTGLLRLGQAQDLVLAASEAVTNALIHGVAPVTVRIWIGEDRVVVVVHDEGEGPADPLVGLLPRTDEGTSSGRGLWIAHQLDIDVALFAVTGFTARLRADRAETMTTVP